MGKSDPYVKCYFNNNQGEFSKSKAIQDNNNPEWN